MKIYVALLECGIVALDDIDSSKVIDALSFSKDDMVKHYSAIKRGTAVAGVSELLLSLKEKGYSSLLCSEPTLIDAALKHGFEASQISIEDRLRLQHNKIPIMLNARLASDEEDAMSILQRFASDMSSQRVAEASAKLDQHIIQGINALDELDKMINMISARLREWYGLHFPELEALIQSITTYANIIIGIGDRKSISMEALRELRVSDSENRLNAILESARGSKGGEISEGNLGMIRLLAEELKRLEHLRDTLAKHLDTEMERVAPNLKDILGTTIGARMIAKVGGLDRLATLPASTIQVLGAEKALFRSLRTGTRPPKHGILFQHPLVHSAPRWQRGKIARVIASKVALAARVDVYSGIRDQDILTKMNERIEEIRSKYKSGREEVEERVEIVRGRERGRSSKRDLRRDYKDKEREKYNDKEKDKEKERRGKGRGRDRHRVRVKGRKK